MMVVIYRGLPVKAKTYSKQKLMKKTSTLRKQFIAAKKPRDKIKKSINSPQAQKTRKSFFEDEQSFRELFENMSSCVAVYTVSANGKDFVFKDFNKAAEKADKIDREKIIGKSVLKVFPGVKDFGLFKVFQRVWKTGKPEHHPTAFYKDNRIQGWKENYVYKLPTGEIVAIYDDVTERKKAEAILRESEENFRRSMDDSSLGIRIVTAEGETLYANQAVLETYDYESIEELRKTPLKERYTPESYAEFQIRKQKRGRGEVGSSEYEISIVRKNGEIRHIQVFRKEVIWNGAKQFQIIYQDITERKQMEEALRESGKLYHSLFENMLNGFAYCKVLFDQEQAQDFVYLEVNDAFKKLTGLKDVVGKKVTEIIPGIREKDPALFEIYGRVALTGKPVTFEINIASLGVWHSVSLYSPRKEYFVSVFNDITKHKRAEEVLRESEEKYRNLVERANDGICITQDTILQYVNPQLAKMIGYSVEELIGLRFADFFIPEEIPKVTDRSKRRLAGEDVAPVYESALRHRDGGRIDIEVNAGIVTYKGKLANFILVRNITVRKRIEKALRESEENFRRSMDDSSLGIRIATAEGETLYANQAVLDMYGYASIDELRKTPLKERYTPESYAEFQIRKQKRGRGEVGSSEYEISIVRKNGEIRHIQVFRKEVIWNGAKQFQVIYHDITKRKNAEDELRKSEEKYRTILENIEDGYYEVDLNGNFTFFNDSMCRILGYPQEEMMGMNNRQYTDEENAKKLFQAFNEVYRTGEPAKEFDWQIIRKDGTKRYIEASVSLQKDSSGKPTGFRGIIRDITERKRAEETLQESEKYFKEITENSSDIIIITDKNGDIKYCSRSIERFTGYKPEELIGRSALTLIHPDDKKRAVGDFGKAILTIDSAIPNAFRIVHKDGSERYFEGLGKNLLDNPAVAGFIMNVRDITERKQAEEVLRQSEEKYRTIIENIQDGYFEIDLAGNFTFVNDAECRNIGYSREELIGMNNRQFQDETNAQRMYQLFRELYRTGEPIKALDVEIIRKNGTKGFNEISVSLIRDAEGKPIGFRGISRDITERKQAEKALQESEERYRLLANNMQDQVWLMDMNLKPTYISPSVEKIRGYTFEEIAQLPLDKQFTATSLQSAMEFFSIEMPKALADPTYFALPLELEFYCKDGSTLWVESTFSQVRDENGKPLSLLGVGRDITERKQAEDERKRSFQRVRKALGATVQAISMTVEMKDPYTSGHQQRVADLARSMATEMGLSTDRQDFIRTASSIHDIGKIAIPSEILSKPTKLTDLEFNLIKTHSQSGYDILKDIEFPWPVADVVLQHHERMDGSGYPHGLKGDDILPEARILAIADVVEAISSHRPYRPALGIDLALEEISRNKGILYDADAVDVCLKLFREKGYTLVIKK